ncbi:HNH endonuclease [Aestuariivirga sp.]|uniref:HNH endonuclease n=1 Tax=Aestuariivirga sp. TaxID=2650926 RepID=UPI003BAAE6CB
MPFAAPRICDCGHKIPSGTRCPCQVKRDQVRKARFDRTRPSASARGYDRQWSRESKIYLRNNPACTRCGNPASLVDHIQPHKGNQKLFWNRGNWQSLCTGCHSTWKQSQERSTP